MELLPYHFKVYQIDETKIELAIPDDDALKDAWNKQHTNNFPYWGKSWPAAEALAMFISANRQLFTHQRVLEIGAGLGLPSLIAARFAKSITSSDYLPMPLEYISISAKKNSISQLNTSVLNWHDLPEYLPYDMILLSDINYDPAELDHLYQLIIKLTRKNIKIVLSTPQRLIAVNFIQRLTHMITQQQQYSIKGIDTWVGLLSTPAKTDNI
jgi:predicted nicotinamide N-methyase